MLDLVRLPSDKVLKSDNDDPLMHDMIALRREIEKKERSK